MRGLLRMMMMMRGDRLLWSSFLNTAETQRQYDCGNKEGAVIFSGRLLKYCPSLAGHNL